MANSLIRTHAEPPARTDIRPRCIVCSAAPGVECRPAVRWTARIGYEPFNICQRECEHPDCIHQFEVMQRTCTGCHELLGQGRQFVYVADPTSKTGRSPRHVECSGIIIEQGAAT